MSLLFSHYTRTIKFISIPDSQHVWPICYDYNDIKREGGCGPRRRDFANVEPPLCTDVNTKGILRLTGDPRCHGWDFFADELLSSQLAFLMPFKDSLCWTVLSPDMSLACGKGYGELRKPMLKKNCGPAPRCWICYLLVTLFLYKINASGPRQIDPICNNLQ